MKLLSLSTGKNQMEASGGLSVKEKVCETPQVSPVEGLYAANCEEFMASMPEECVDLVVTSTPYDNLRNYKGYSFEFERIAEGLFKVIKAGGVLVWQRKLWPLHF
jgi:site-specific DNA-methyltransferase (adenine-specific)